MTRLIPLNLPVRWECLKIPVEWTRKLVRHSGTTRGGEEIEFEEWSYSADLIDEPRLDTYDAWELRSEFLRIERDDSEALFAFLKKVGLFDRATVTDVALDSRLLSSLPSLGADIADQPTRDEEHFWEMRNWIEHEMLGKTNNLDHFRFDVQFARKGKHDAYLLVTTSSFMEALAVSVCIDRAQRAQVRKCARPDCGALFAVTTNRKQKYCVWNCGHVEAVRRQREKERQRKAARKVAIQTAKRARRVPREGRAR
jgi:hypothetical protein